MVSNQTTMNLNKASMIGGGKAGDLQENLNPVTKKYLQKIEKAFTYTNTTTSGKGRESIDSRSAGVDGQMYEKYKAMRDTAIDIGKWINGGIGKSKHIKVQ